MRIGINFHTSDEYISGVEYYSLGLLKELLRIDTRNEYIVYTNRPDLIRRHMSLSGNIVIVHLKRLKTRAARILWEHFELPKRVKQEKLDILHCPHYICPLFGRTVPYVVTVHDTIAIDHPFWCKVSNSLYYNIVMKRALQRASRVIAVSHSTAESLKRNFSISEPKVRIIHPGIDAIFNSNNNHLRQIQVKRRYGLPQRYILFVGNIEPKKNISKLVEAYKLLRNMGLGHKLVMVGKRSWKCGNVWNHIRREVNAGNIILAGYVEREDLPFVYQMSEVFVFVSLYEGFGFPPLEAMACGTPVVASAAGALSETAGRASYTVDPTDVKSIAKAIYLLITDRKLRQKHVELGVRESERFMWGKTAEQTLSVYEEVCASNAR